MVWVTTGVSMASLFFVLPLTSTSSKTVADSFKKTLSSSILGPMSTLMVLDSQPIWDMVNEYVPSTMLLMVKAPVADEIAKRFLPTILAPSAGCKVPACITNPFI